MIIKILTSTASMLALATASHAQSAPQSEPSAQSATVQPADEVTEPDDDNVIIVTAQKRSENLQDVPISAIAVDAATLDRANVTDVTQVQRLVPNLVIARAQNTTNQNVRIRGIGSGSSTAIEPSVAFFLDGVYVPRAGSIIGNLVDVAGVEVLRGPQGTLFGRNASMGAISIKTREPEFVRSMSAKLRYGNYEQVRADLTANLPVTDTFAVRVAGSAEYYGGDFISLNPAPHKLGRTSTVFGRVSALWQPTDRLSWLVKADYQTISGDGQVPYELDPKTLPANNTFPNRLDPDGPGPLTGPSLSTGDPFDRVVSNYLFGVIDDQIWGVTSDINYELGGGYDVRLINGYRNWHSEPKEGDAIQTPVPLVRRNQYYDSESQSHELQIISPERGLFGGAADFVAGLYYYKEDYAIDTVIDLLSSYCRPFLQNIIPSLAAPCAAGPQDNAGADYFDQQTISKAAYAQATLHLSDAVRLVGGLRYTNDKKDGGIVQVKNNPAELFHTNENTPLALSEDRVTYRLGAEFDLSRDIFLFGSYSTGFKSGGFNSSFSSSNLGQSRLFRAETVDNYELGVRSQLLDRRITANVTAFRTTIYDLQDRGFDGLQFLTRNVGSLRQQGIEFDLSARPVSGALLGIAGAYLDSEYLDFQNAPNLPGLPGTQDLTGTRANFSPEWQGNVYAQYDTDLPGGFGLLGRVDMKFVSDANLGSDSNNNPDTIQPGYQLVSGTLALSAPDDRWQFSLFGENLLDQGYCIQKVTQTAESILGVRDPTRNSTAIRCIVGQPRRYGVELKVSFD